MGGGGGGGGIIWVRSYPTWGPRDRATLREVKAFVSDVSLFTAALWVVVARGPLGMVKWAAIAVHGQ